MANTVLTLDADAETVFNFLNTISAQKAQWSRLPQFDAAFWDTHTKMCHALVDGSDIDTLKTILSDSLGLDAVNEKPAPDAQV
jgi:hypothetical protein